MDTSVITLVGGGAFAAVFSGAAAIYVAHLNRRRRDETLVAVLALRERAELTHQRIGRRKYNEAGSGGIDQLALEYANTAVQKLEPYEPLTTAVQELLAAGDAFQSTMDADALPRATRAARRIEVITRMMAHQHGKELPEPGRKQSA